MRTFEFMAWRFRLVQRHPPARTLKAFVVAVVPQMQWKRYNSTTSRRPHLRTQHAALGRRNRTKIDDRELFNHNNNTSKRAEKKSFSQFFVVMFTCRANGAQRQAATVRSACCKRAGAAAEDGPPFSLLAKLRESGKTADCGGWWR